MGPDVMITLVFFSEAFLLAAAGSLFAAHELRKGRAAVPAQHRRDYQTRSQRRSADKAVSRLPGPNG
jgi:hypothetical protein